MSRPIAIVTGASSGIGAVYADRLAARGFDLILVARDTERLRASANRLTEKYAIVATPFTADLTKAEDVQSIVTRIREDDAISFLVNSAGISPGGPVLVSSDADLDRTVFLSVNVLHTLTVAAAKSFSTREGSGASSISHRSSH
ncbi:SDR family NAD(P)-dependent oxidoreductase [Rhizobium skierniewicense]|uniref:SDR family NAD(P)-dependent oxidoreductase n=1 Tax=Rhizobium skierniewicense TaxID=984260 RepID=UPI001572C8F3|nr:SDR family NAD(P)-dependent oxidoreductase [Rhizobium skierniewicense]NTF34818.1 SDR family NAD(P)-dependent oxidoreductase [Rhizobium skierniewicense]